MCLKSKSIEAGTKVDEPREGEEDGEANPARGQDLEAASAAADK